MSDCYFCGWREGKHDPYCPRKETVEWKEGKSDGRSGKDAAHRGPVYQLGFGRGVVAREEAENGFDPVAEGRQW